MKIALTVPLEDVVESIWDQPTDPAELKCLIESIDRKVADVDFTMELIRTLSESLKDEMTSHSDEGLKKVQKKIDKFITFIKDQLDV